MPETRTPPPARPNWDYNSYFLAQLKKRKQQRNMLKLTQVSNRQAV